MRGGYFAKWAGWLDLLKSIRAYDATFAGPDTVHAG